MIEIAGKKFVLVEKLTLAHMQYFARILHTFFNRLRGEGIEMQKLMSDGVQFYLALLGSPELPDILAGIFTADGKLNEDDLTLIKAHLEELSDDVIKRALLHFFGYIIQKLTILSE